MKQYHFKWVLGIFILLLTFQNIQAQTDTLCNPNENKKIFGEAFFTYGGVTNSFSSFNRSDFTVGQAVITVTNMLSQNYQIGFGQWSPWLLPPQPPTFLASQGDFKDRIKLEWEINALSPAPSGFKIYRDGSFLIDLDGDTRQFLDFNVQAGEYYEYSIVSRNTFGQGASVKYVGFVNPNGVVTGKIETNSGNPVPGVEVRLTPITGSSMSFDGVDDQLCVSFDEKLPTTAFTVSAYVKLGTTNNESGIIDWGSGLNKNWWITTTKNNEAKGYIFHIGNGTGSDTLKYFIPVNNSNLLANDEKWHQITMVYNGSAMSVMVDGNYVGTKASTIVREKQHINIGSKTTAGFYKGLLDDIRVYNRPLTQTEVNATKNRSVSKTEAGLVAYWKMDEGVGIKVFDNSNKPTNANIYGGATFSSDKPEVYNSGISDVTGYYNIDGINYSTTESFRATPIKNFEFNTALEFNAADKSYGNLTNYDIPDTSTVEVLFHPFDLKSRQTVLSKGSLYELYVDNSKLFLNLNGTITDLGTIKAKYYHVAVAMNNTIGNAKVYLEGDLLANISFVGTSNWGVGNPWLVATNSTDPTGKFYTGLIDEVAIYKKALPQNEIQVHYVTGIPQDSTTANLFSYFDFNEGTEAKVYDYAAISFGATAPREGIITKASWSNNVRRNSSKPHEFEPNVRVVNLNTSNTAIGNIDFKDVSTVNISGYVRFANTFCFEDTVKILVNGLPHFPPIVSDKKGKWSADFEPGRTIKLTALYKDHTFSPNFMEFRKLQAPKAGIVFLDNTKRTIRGQIAGGLCKKSIIPAGGRVIVKVATLDGCFEKVDTIKNTNGQYLFKDLPARAFRVSITEHSNGIINTFFQTKGGSEVDMRDKADTTVNFTYIAPPQVALDDFAANDCGLRLIGQNMPQKLKIRVFEEYTAGDVNSRCYLDSAKLTITNDISNEVKVVTLDSTVYDYKFIPKIVNLVPPYTNTITVKAEANGSFGLDTSRAIVLGYKNRGKTFTTSTPEMPQFILRDPPGDKSFSTLEKGSTICSEITHSVVNNATQQAYVQPVIGGDQSIVLGIGLARIIKVKSSIAFKAEVGADQVWTNTTAEKRCMTTLSTFSTQADDFTVGKVGGDVYIGAAYNVTYGQTDELNFSKATCAITQKTILGVDDTRLKGEFAYSEYQIVNDVIPSLKELSETMTNPRRVEDSIAYRSWQKYVKMNREDKDQFKFQKRIAFDAGAIREESQEETQDITASFSFDKKVFTATAVDADIETSFAGINVGGEVRFEHTISTSTSNDTSSSMKITYHLEDDDIGDNFLVAVYKGKVWSTPYFDLEAGESMCPWEPGTLKRETVGISIDKAAAVNVPENTVAVFELTLSNNSQTAQTMAYKMSEIAGTNPSGAGIDIVSGENFDSDIIIGPFQSKKFLMAVAKGPIEYNYSQLKIAGFSSCQYARAVRNGEDPKKIDIRAGEYIDEDAFYKELSFDVNFIQPCSPVEISFPLQDWVVTPAGGNILSITLNEYNKSDPNLKLIRLQYRSIGGDGSWINITEIQKANLGDIFTIRDWNTSLVRDGRFEIRAVAECINPGLQAGISTIIKGTLEREPPELVGVPQPSDGTWDPGDEVSITFNENLNCDKVIQADVLANNTFGLYDATTNKLVDSRFTCVGNKIVIVPNINPKDYENRVFRVVMSGKDYDDAQTLINPLHQGVAIQDKAGNKIPLTIKWEFAVNQNNLEWVGPDIIESNTVLKPFSVKRQIRNRGGTIASFRMEDIPSWLTVSPATGTLNPGQTADITLTFQQDLLIGDYLETLKLVGSKGAEPLLIDYRVRCAAPNYVVNNLSEYEGTMSMVIDLSIFGVRSTDPSDIIVAKIDGQVRGVGKVSYYRNIPADKVRWLTFMTIYGNADDIGKPIEFHIWDGDKCNEYVEVLEQIVYQEGDLIGSPLVPQPIHILNLVKKCIPLNRGWNWVSFNLNLGDGNNVVSKVLASLKNKTGTIIKSDDFNARYYGVPINSWLGTLTSISPQKRYMINVADKDTICMKGQPYVSGDFPITIRQGWNWVGYVPSTGMSVTQALAGLTPLNGDIIKSQTLFAQYIAGVGWVGNLSFLEPLKGYLMKISNAGTLVYPTGGTNGPNATNGANTDGEISPKALEAQAAQEAPMTFDFTKYQFTMNLIGKVNGMTIDADDELRAYIDGQLVGINKSISYAENRLFFQTIYFQDESNINFKLYKADRKKEYKLNRTIPFVAETLAGLVDDPIIFDLETTTLVPISIVINDQLIWQPNKIFPTVSIANAVSGQSTSCASFTFNTILPTATETSPVCVAQTGLEGNMFGVMKINYNERSTFVSSSDVLSFINPATGLIVGCGTFDSQFNVFNFTVKGGVSSIETPIDVKYYSNLMKKSFLIKSGVMYKNNKELGDYITPSPLDVSPISISINAGVITAVLRDTSWTGKYCLDAFALNCPNFSDGQTTFCFQRLKQGGCVDIIVRNITENTDTIVKAVAISSEVIVNAGIRLEYKGGSKIELKPGFETKVGTVFTGKIEGCSN